MRKSFGSSCQDATSKGDAYLISGRDRNAAASLGSTNFLSTTSVTQFQTPACRVFLRERGENALVHLPNCGPPGPSTGVHGLLDLGRHSPGQVALEVFDRRLTVLENPVDTHRIRDMAHYGQIQLPALINQGFIRLGGEVIVDLDEIVPLILLRANREPGLFAIPYDARARRNRRISVGKGARCVDGRSETVSRGHLTAPGKLKGRSPHVTDRSHSVS